MVVVSGCACVFGGSVHNEAKPIFYLGGRKVLYSGHVGGRELYVMSYCKR